VFDKLNHRTIVIVLLLIALVIIVGFFIFVSNKEQVADVELNQPKLPKTTKLVIKDVEISAEIADEPGKIVKGLSGRTSLGENSGMYFVLGKRKIASFWMKDMKFPLDIIWIDNGGIVYIVEEAPTPDDNIPSFTPTQPATHVLEVNAGFAKKHSIKIGDRVEVKRN